MTVKYNLSKKEGEIYMKKKIFTCAAVALSTFSLVACHSPTTPNRKNTENSTNSKVQRKKTTTSYFKKRPGSIKKNKKVLESLPRDPNTKQRSSNANQPKGKQSSNLYEKAPQKKKRTGSRIKIPGLAKQKRKLDTVSHKTTNINPLHLEKN